MAIEVLSGGSGVNARLQEKTVSALFVDQYNVGPDEGYDAISLLTLNPRSNRTISEIFNNTSVVKRYYEEDDKIFVDLNVPGIPLNAQILSIHCKLHTRISATEYIDIYPTINDGFETMILYPISYSTPVELYPWVESYGIDISENTISFYGIEQIVSAFSQIRSITADAVRVIYIV